MNKVCLPDDDPLYADALRSAAATCLAKGDMNPEDIIKVLRKLSQFDKRDYTDEEIEEEAYIACEYAAKTPKGRKPISALVSEYVDTLRSTEKEITFNIQDVYKDLNLTTPVDRHSCRMALHRFCGTMVEKFGTKSGYYKIIGVQHLNEIDLWGDTAKPLQIKYPLGLSDLIITHPKNILVIAGEPNAGKSAYLLNFAMFRISSNALIKLVEPPQLDFFISLICSSKVVPFRLTNSGSVLKVINLLSNGFFVIFAKINPRAIATCIGSPSIEPDTSTRAMEETILLFFVILERIVFHWFSIISSHLEGFFK